MNKEFEALKILRPNTTYEPYYTRSERRNACSIIETALEDYEAMLNQYNLKRCYEIVIEKLNALDILKEKEWFDDFMKEHLTREWFTQDELDLLKRVLK